MNQLVRKTFQEEQVPLKWWQTAWEIYTSILIYPDSVFEQTNKVEQIPQVRRQVLWRTFSHETISPDKEAACQWNIICLPC